MDDKKGKRASFFGMVIGSLFGRRKGEMSLMEEEQVQSPLRTLMKEFFRRKLTIIGLIGFFGMLFASIIIPFFFPIDLREMDAGQVNVAPSRNMMRIPSNIRGDVVHLAAGFGYGLAVTNDHRIHAWGTVSTIAEQILEPTQLNRPISHISAGPYHALAVTEDGYIVSWGNPNPAFDIHNIPANVQGRVVAAEAGMRVSLAILDDGSLASWGGMAMVRRDTVATGRVPRTETPVKLVANVFTFGVLTAEGNVYVLMQTPRSIRYVPDEIQGRIVDFALTNDNGAALLDDGTVVIWGDGVDAYLFDVPEDIQGRVIAVDGGRAHFTALLDDGSVASWGRNVNGRTNAPRITNATEIFVSGDHNYARLEDGSFATWGLRGFIFGTDGWGRCVFTRMWHAGRYSLLIGMVAVVVMGIIGLLLGGFAGYYGGALDMFIMRLAEVVQSLPFLPIALILRFRFGHLFGEVGSMVFLMFVMGVLGWAGLMRMVRAQILQAKASEYVLAARALGVRQFSIIFRHILPNVASAAIVLLTLALASSMLTETALSFIGFGVREPVPTWGNMLSGSNSSIVLVDQWWRWVFPAVALVTVAISINLIGDGLREATDPRSQGR